MRAVPENLQFRKIAGFARVVPAKGWFQSAPETF